jgi:hypothetical protein
MILVDNIAFIKKTLETRAYVPIMRYRNPLTDQRRQTEPVV